MAQWANRIAHARHVMNAGQFDRAHCDNPTMTVL